MNLKRFLPCIAVVARYNMARTNCGKITEWWRFIAAELPAMSISSRRLLRSAIAFDAALTASGEPPSVTREMTNPLIDKFVTTLGMLPAGVNAFNPWNISTAAGAICRHNLSLYLHELANRQTRILLLGEAPGYQGCRLTGISFTSEHLLLRGVPELDMLGSTRGYRKVPSDNRISKEPSATIVWNTLAELDFLPLLWPAFPFHPHKPGNPRSNRPPRRAEIEFGRPLWQELATIMGIEQFVAIGNVGHASLAAAGIDAIKIRHPSQGGKPQFVEGIRHLAAPPTL